jgi:pyridinium-3,5-biscarboxylic acid mononucleotide synthase
MSVPSSDSDLQLDPLAVTFDGDRSARCGYPEVIYGEGKPADTIAAITRKLLSQGERVLATRVDSGKAQAIVREFPEAVYNPIARTLRVNPDVSPPPLCGQVVVVSAGTSDRSVAEEALETLHWMGCRVEVVHDVGVAGPHRLPGRLDTLRQADAIVVVAGMEGALPSVVGGYVSVPIFAVPTSVGYGANLGGVAALLSMLNSCAANVAVVNIDAGFKGAYLAGLVAQRSHPKDTA